MTREPYCALTAKWRSEAGTGAMDWIQQLAIAGAGALVGVVGSFLYNARLDARRREHDVALLLRTERREAVARLLGAIDEYQAAVETYAERGSFVKRGLGEWGSPPSTRELESSVQVATMLANDGSPLMLGVYAAYAAARLIPTEHPNAHSPEWEKALEQVRDAKEQLITAVRTELGVSHWLSPELQKAMGERET